MPEVQLLGLFEEATSAAEAIDRLHASGVDEKHITVLSDIPYRPRFLGRRSLGGTIGLAALVGGVLGVFLGIALTFGLWFLYPLLVGGQPLYAIPPTLIIVFEMTMLGAMWTTFGAFLVANRFPVFGDPPYSSKIEEGMIGVLVRVPEARAGEVERLLREAGAESLERFGEERKANDRVWFGAAVVTLGVVLVGLVLIELGAYDVIKVDFPSNMVDQPSIADLEGPRLAAPPAAIPIQGPVLIAGQPATEPHPATADSLQRGQVLYSINCQMCHGPQGKGDGIVGAFFAPTPADLTSAAIQGLSDQQIFLVIQQGFGVMPSQHENLGSGDTWDVINYVRSLQK